jgi:hypothetical protein
MSWRQSRKVILEVGVMAREWKSPSAERVVSMPIFAEDRIL